MECIIYVAKTKALTSFAVTEQLICAFAFAYAKTVFLNYVCARRHYIRGSQRSLWPLRLTVMEPPAKFILFADSMW